MLIVYKLWRKRALLFLELSFAFLSILLVWFLVLIQLLENALTLLKAWSCFELERRSVFLEADLVRDLVDFRMESAFRDLFLFFDLLLGIVLHFGLDALLVQAVIDRLFFPEDVFVLEVESSGRFVDFRMEGMMLQPVLELFELSFFELDGFWFDGLHAILVEFFEVVIDLRFGPVWGSGLRVSKKGVRLGFSSDEFDRSHGLFLFGIFSEPRKDIRLFRVFSFDDLLGSSVDWRLEAKPMGVFFLSSQALPFFGMLLLIEIWKWWWELKVDGLDCVSL